MSTRDQEKADLSLTEGLEDLEALRQEIVPNFEDEEAARELLEGSLYEIVREYYDAEFPPQLPWAIRLVSDEGYWPSSAVEEAAVRYSLKKEAKLKLLIDFSSSAFYSNWAAESGEDEGLNILREKWEAEQE